MAKRRTATRTAQPPMGLDKRLVLNQWVLSLFNVNTFAQLKGLVGGDNLEGVDAENVTKFHNVLKQSLLGHSGGLTADLLLAYDQNIVRHWKAITDRRNRLEKRVLWPKYFQYLALLFTEIYLDRYCRDAGTLLADLNAQVAAFNADVAEQDRVGEYTPTDLRMLAFWMATGSGKTLLMHVNVLQYRHYLGVHGRSGELNRIILLTPNEGLSRQHLEEFETSGLAAEIFNPDGRGLFAGRSIEIIEVTKLKEEKKKSTVAVDSFEGNNLVLVDEGHRGAGGEQWMDVRARLAEHGFSFEYSATYKQALKAADDERLTRRYCRSILFDYSYKYFYGDGYGKEYHILNLAEDKGEEQQQLYLVACLLSFYQQQRVWTDRRAELVPFLIDKPLWVFVGGSVNAVRTESKQKVSDVVAVLQFLNGFVKDRAASVRMIDVLLGGRAGLRDEGGRDVFANKFGHLAGLGLTAEAIFAGVLKTTFNAEAGGLLHIDNLKGAEGELGLRLGESDYFGVINVGDEAELLKLCAANGLVTADKEFSQSLFAKLNTRESCVNVLIGSRKFTEGWSSWRVSTMGLMNIGKSEGSQIIQLFGRGVRLKGFEFGLKRSKYLPAHAPRPPQAIGLAETLNVFGVRANYMVAFREYLKDEGVSEANEKIEILIPVVKLLGDKKLKVLALPKDISFKRDGPRPTLGEVPKRLTAQKVQVDWYPRLQAETSPKNRTSGPVTERHEGYLTERHVAFMDVDAIYFELQRYKAERSWHNLNLPKSTVVPLLLDHRWYDLYIPADELNFAHFRRVRVWQEIAVALLKKFVERYYKYSQGDWEKDKLRPILLTEENENFDFGERSEMRVLIEDGQQELATALGQLAQQIKDGTLTDWSWRTDLHAIGFGPHLFRPLLFKPKGIGNIEVLPVALVESEYQFVRDLRAYFDGHRPEFEGKEFHLLRNRSRRGIGFFEAGGFYPDFILWLLDGDRQHIVFVDPKGLRNVEGRLDPKIEFHRTIKDLQAKVNEDDPSIVLSSFIVSSTAYEDAGWWSHGFVTKADFAAANVLFQLDGDYVDLMFKKIAGHKLAVAVAG